MSFYPVSFYGKKTPGGAGTHKELRHRYRQSQFAGLTRLQLDEVGRERQVQRQGRQRAEALAEGSVELAQAMVPLASALARGGGCRVSVCSAVMRGGVLVC